ncbi:UDP-N-acetylmuramoyl-tripeptide--D-alanyl-D-alanine ligase [Collinsella tanakaei]|uniref:UDP-N-acetylmuramoyl-tripeptide--D-alanyl-D- alanine ligase n=1 Tax=Collinsella tanakaei TaxID=626935 RepID=UPI0025A33BB4|nr:UDP-N-acetylmuramoyl-tripeptide--D-alanyl-D-alanine ligase [Collinsella tanakaei]MDM8299691.1 UDP-N-acetylmuramoyl-tripeptide--D-alanyl-D-alanine ligase [Collinsella tanakaei]
MIEIAVKRIEEVCSVRVLAADPERICRGCVIDSRLVERDSIFVAFPGERVDGNDFALSAIEAQAGCVVLTREPSADVLEAAARTGCAVLLSDDPTEFLLDLAHEFRMSLPCTVIGVTGSIGKTTTKDSLAALLSARYRVHVTAGNYNNLIGMPLTILAAPRDTEVMVLEMGMDGFGQIERLSQCARPDYAVITKIGTSHIGFLGSRENIARAKAEILAGMDASGTCERGGAPALVLNGEDDFTPFIIEQFARPAGIEVILCGTSEGDDVHCGAIELDDHGCPLFTLTFADGSHIDTKLAIPGAQSVTNALFAAALAHRLGIDAATIDERFGALQITGRRTQVRDAACGARIIDDSYNAAPESMAAALDLLCSLPATGRRMALLGEMGELGGEGERLHALTGAYAAAKKLDELVCVGGDNARCMAEAARLLGMPEERVHTVSDTEAAIGLVAGDLRPDDLVLVKGSRFVGLDRFVEEVC